MPRDRLRSTDAAGQILLLGIANVTSSEACWLSYSHASRPEMAAAVSNACSDLFMRLLIPALCQHTARMVHRPSATAQP